jgi:hypothetical protein
MPRSTAGALYLAWDRHNALPEAGAGSVPSGASHRSAPNGAQCSPLQGAPLWECLDDKSRYRVICWCVSRGMELKP